MAKIITYHGSLDALVWFKERKNMDADTELVVPVSHEAVFIKDGQIMDSFTMGRYDLKECCVGDGHLFSASDEHVDCRIYYVKKEGGYSIKWNVNNPVCFNDPVLKIPVEFDLSGVFTIKIIDSKKFLQKLLAFTRKAELGEVKAFFRDRMLVYIKDELLSAMAENKVSIIELPRKLMTISKELEFKMRYIFESLGVSVENFMLKKVELLSGGEKCEDKVEGASKEKKGARKSIKKAVPEEDVKAAPAEIMYCPKCGVDLPPMSVYCFRCGEKVE